MHGESLCILWRDIGTHTIYFTVKTISQRGVCIRLVQGNKERDGA